MKKLVDNFMFSSLSQLPRFDTMPLIVSRIAKRPAMSTPCIITRAKAVIHSRDALKFITAFNYLIIKKGIFLDHVQL